MPFGKLQEGRHVPSTEEWLLSAHFIIKAGLGECCKDGCLSGRFSHLQRNRIVGHLPDQDPSPRSLSLASYKEESLGCSKLLSFKNDGGLCVLGDLQRCRHVWVPFPRRYHSLDTILSLSSTDNSFDLMA